MNRRNVLAVLAAAFLAACGGTTPTTTGTGGGGGGGGSNLVPAPVGTSPVRGPSDAWVTIVLYSDFQCPYCANFQATLLSVLPSYGSDVRLVFKHYPLSFHTYARTTAIAAECAHQQGRFWELHDLVFANRSTLFSGPFESQLLSLATQAGLDLSSWQACRSDPASAAIVDGDESAGSYLGVSGTPTSFVNGVMVVGAAPASSYRAVIDAALARAKASGIPASEYYDRAVLGH